MFQRMKDGSLVRAPSCSAPHTHRRRRSSSSRAPHFSLLDAKNTDAVIDVCSFTFKSFGRPIPRSIWDEKVEKGGNFKEKKKFFPGNCPVATCLHRSFYFRCCCFFLLSIPSACFSNTQHIGFSRNVSTRLDTLSYVSL